MNESMSDKADCRTAPATPGLLNIGQSSVSIKYNKLDPKSINHQIL